MNNTPNNENRPSVQRPQARAARRPVTPPSAPQSAPMQTPQVQRPVQAQQAAQRRPVQQAPALQTPVVQRPTAAPAVPPMARRTPAAPAPTPKPTPVQPVQPAQTVQMPSPPPAVDNTATRLMATPVAEAKQPGRDAKAKSVPMVKPPKKKKKQMSEGAATLLSVVKAIMYIVFVIVIAGFLSYAIIRLANDVFAFVKSDEQVTVVIPENATIYDVSEVLSEAKIIAYPDVFELYAKLKKDNGEFMAGEYEINGMMNYGELLMAFKEKIIRGTIWLTIPEGFTVDEIIDLFIENNIGGTREDWVAAVNNRELYTDFEFVKALLPSLNDDRTYLLEGYLFPDTYEFYTDAKASQIVYKLLNRFNNVFREEFYTRAEELGYTVDEVIILASMIEKETRLYQEFEQVSSVFHNRLRDPANYPYLESDATIMYAIHHDSGERKEDMTAEDVDYVSPYNTYTNRGLPPGPIANPSYQAITCALYPEETPYYYFVSRKNGETIFSRNYAEHQAAIAEVRREG